MHRLLAALITLAVTPTVGFADTGIIVLGIRSVEGDDEISRNLTGALRQAASSVDGWIVAEAEVSLAQMTMVHGCTEPDAACMSEIANELGQQRVIYGTVRRTGAGDEYGFALTLYMFNAESGQIEDSLTDSIDNDEAGIDALRTRALRYVAQLSGQARYGVIRLVVNRPGASVQIDGEAMGQTDDNGVLVMEDIAEGQRDIRIEASGYETFSGNVRVVADEQSEFRANLVSDGGGMSWIPGAVLIGVGAVSLAVGISQGVPNLRARKDQQDISSMCNDDDGCSEEILQNANTLRTDPTGARDLSRRDFFGAMRNIAGGRENSACSEETISQVAGDSQGRARSICDDQDRRRTLSIVFNILGGALIAGGTALLVLSLLSGDDDAEESARLRLSPVLGRRQAGLMAHLEF
ncbi:MAG: PEGA domain-containing protein [Myxococcota bacterium]